MIHVYTGNGKGKTTAAIGLAVRCAGYGYPVYIAQFLKRRITGECRALKKFKNVTLRQFGRGCFVGKRPSASDRAAARRGYARTEAAIAGKKHRLVILDEINVAVSMGLISQKELFTLIEAAGPECDLVLTGRGASPALVRRADLVTEMKERRHYHKRGVAARKGIEC